MSVDTATGIGRYYLGGIVRPSNRLYSLCTNSSRAVAHGPQRDNSRAVLFQSGHWQCATRGMVQLCIRGCAYRHDANEGITSPHDIAEWMIGKYSQEGDIPVDALEGSFTVVVVDHSCPRVVMYRNLVGTGFTYYCESSEGRLFASNLADLIRHAPDLRAVNEMALPGFFLYRCVTGRDTLFKDVFRLMPGEQVVLDSSGIHRAQRQTLATLAYESPSRDSIECLETTMRSVIGSYLGTTDEVANLLSGGVDSTYLQVHLCAAQRRRHDASRSYCAHLQHPQTQEDADYARTAAEALQVDHRAVSVDGPIIDRLRETIEATGEPLNHVQSAYFLLLARHMVANGSPVAFCGEGADSLFGIGDVLAIRRAERIRQVLPHRVLRQLGMWAAKRLGHFRADKVFAMAECLGHEGAWSHPVNQIAMFTDWDAIAECFPAQAIDEALSRRRSLLSEFHVPNSLLSRVHAMGYFGEASETASLWNSLFNVAGGDLLCPFLDSRMLAFAASLPSDVTFSQVESKWLLKAALSRHVPAHFSNRPKRGFGQPIMEWMSSGGDLRQAVEGIDSYEFLPRGLTERLLKHPSWFLYSLLVYDIWHKAFIDA